jgi:hypothetical protein
MKLRAVYVCESGVDSTNDTRASDNMDALRAILDSQWSAVEDVSTCV